MQVRSSEEADAVGEAVGLAIEPDGLSVGSASKEGGSVAQLPKEDNSRAEVHKSTVLRVMTNECEGLTDQRKTGRNSESP